ncbi:MAG: PBP1A family penicillin-binding protein [Candidatus Marinimicrobia bacterium]|nr:PBP1A family penicillin-binding protein [Candidatus Neomarinimicrobiota bacterium]MCF7828880.1 PBP1A family penicillin-binding protein [Candidatus Neomarinimicrobiota bacterium]MCF7880798.1 PBP1A family penicillin-binding protein [Candidatus Neomarinimicrobiota bacterium]
MTNHTPGTGTVHVRQQKPSHWERLKKRFIISLIIVFAVGFGLLAYLYILSRDLPSLTQLENFDPSLITRIYSSDGVVIKELFTQRRVFIPLDELPPYLVDALISTEDQRFYNHWGFNVVRTFKALAVDIMLMSWEQGASTISQQLARNLYETIGFKKTIPRKIKEAITSIQIERTYTKDEILEMYLNSIYFGHGVYGIEAAAREYYSKRAKDLTLDEAATLVGLLRLPAYYSPINHPDRAHSRRNVVLHSMHSMGYISQPIYRHFASRDIRTESPESDGTGIAPYFTEYVRRQLEREAEALDIDPYRDGLSIYTTLDSRVQAAANRSYNRFIQEQQAALNQRLLNDVDELAEIIDTTKFSVDTLHQMIRGQAQMDSTLRSKLVVQGALVSLNPGTGHILAMIGGRDFRRSKFNRATQAQRQPGSVFKPFIYTTAIDNGYPVTRQLLNQPVVLFLDDTTRWTPQNYDRTTGGLTTLREGLRRSLNLISVRMVQELVPPDRVVEYAHRMGITTRLRAVDALALGTSEVIPLEVTSAYSIFANHGIWTEPVGITRIVDRYGNVLKDYVPYKKEVLSEETAFLMVDLMQGVMNESGGTGTSARWRWGFRRPAGGKTGTTQNFTDAWFVGYTPQIASGVWVGVDNPAVSLGPRRSGATAALPMWATFMKTAHDTLDLPEAEFERPDGIVERKICSESKKLPTQYCPTETEIFNQKYIPTETCNVHGNFDDRQDNSGRRTF